MPQVFSGPRAFLLADGARVGYTGEVSGSETIEYEPVQTINFIEIRENIPVGYGVTLQTNFFRIIGESVKKRGLMPVLENILTSGELTLSIADQQTGQTVEQWEQCKMSERSFSVTARGLVSDQCTWTAIRLRDEYQLSR